MLQQLRRESQTQWRGHAGGPNEGKNEGAADRRQKIQRARRNGCNNDERRNVIRTLWRDAGRAGVVRAHRKSPTAAQNPGFQPARKRSVPAVRRRRPKRCCRRAGGDLVPQALVITAIVVAFSATAMAVALLLRLFKETGQATLSSDDPQNADAHHSGLGRLARPFPWGTFTSYSLPASLAHSAWGHTRPFALVEPHASFTLMS